VSRFIPACAAPHLSHRCNLYHHSEKSCQLYLEAVVSLIFCDFYPLVTKGKKSHKRRQSMNLTIKEILQVRHEGLFTKTEARKMYDEYKAAGIK